MEEASLSYILGNAEEMRFVYFRARVRRVSPSEQPVGTESAKLSYLLDKVISLRQDGKIVVIARHV